MNSAISTCVHCRHVISRKELLCTLFLPGGELECELADVMFFFPGSFGF